MELLNYDLGEGLRAFSTLRNSGGCGRGAYASFNLTPYVEDAEENIRLSRQQLCEHLNIEDPQLVLPHQTHTANVLTIDAHYCSLTEEEKSVQLQEIDALVTQEKAVCIGVSTADCVPLLLHDPTSRTVAAVHAGWRGLVQRIPQKTLSAMTDLGAERAQVRALIGPSIGVESFEVGSEVVQVFLDAGFPESIVARHYSRPHIDLWAACAHLLEEAGVGLENILIAGIDSYQHEDSFFSARRLGLHSGRTYTGIMLQ